MMLLYFILVIIVVYVINKQNTRIDALEKLIKNNSSVPVTNKPNTSYSETSTTSTPVQPAAYTASATTAPVSSPSTPSTSKPLQTSPTQSTTSTIPTTDEEASGRFLGKLGIVAVFIGIAFFLKYAFDNNWIGPEGRIAIGIVLGFAFLAAGHFLREKYLKYSDLLMGGGIAILYLSIFAAHSFYNLIDPTFTGLSLFAVTIIAFLLSIFDATITLSFVAVLGASATPFLVSSGANNMLELFGYLILINLGVLAISFFKKWPSLVALAFFGTGINFISWYGKYYNASELQPTLIFVVVVFLIYLAASLTRVLSEDKIKEIDYLILGANAFALANVGYSILNPQHHSVLGFSSLCVALVYFFVALIANKHRKENHELNIFLAGLAVTFLSIAVPLQFNGEWVAVLWFVESVVLYIMATFAGNRGFQVMGAVVYILGILNLIQFVVFKYRGSDYTPFFNQDFALFLLAIAAAYAIGYIYKRYGSTTLEIQKRGLGIFMIVANILTIIAVTQQISLYYRLGLTSSSDYLHALNSSHTAVSIFWTLYAVLLTSIGFVRRTSSIRRFGLALFVITGFKVFVDVWQLGALYRIISFIVFGVIALIASFLYAKYKDRL